MARWASKRMGADNQIRTRPSWWIVTRSSQRMGAQTSNPMAPKIPWPRSMAYSRSTPGMVSAKNGRISHPGGEQRTHSHSARDAGLGVNVPGIHMLGDRPT